jgi:hypothetical protein
MTTLTFSAGAAGVAVAAAPQAASSIEDTTHIANILSNLIFICSSRNVQVNGIFSYKSDCSTQFTSLRMKGICRIGWIHLSQQWLDGNSGNA